MTDPRYPDDVDPSTLHGQVGAWRKCELCGYENNEPIVAPSMALVASDGREVYMDLIRCKRSDDCRMRCLALGRPWPIVREAPRRG